MWEHKIRVIRNDPGVIGQPRRMEKGTWGTLHLLCLEMTADALSAEYELGSVCSAAGPGIKKETPAADLRSPQKTGHRSQGIFGSRVISLSFLNYFSLPRVVEALGVWSQGAP